MRRFRKYLWTNSFGKSSVGTYPLKTTAKILGGIIEEIFEGILEKNSSEVIGEILDRMLGRVSGELPGTISDEVLLNI